MAAIYYPAVFERAADGVSAYFPDLPGCVSAGDTVEEAMVGAEDALALHLAGLAEEGEPVPPPSRLDAVEPDAEAIDPIVLLVRAERGGRTVRVNITVDEDLLAAIDATAQRAGLSRSRFLAQAARRAMSGS